VTDRTQRHECATPTPPVAPEPAPEVADRAPSRTDPGSTSKPRLLLVEDDLRTQSALRKIFTKLGWEVHSAMTVAGGLALLRLFPPDGLILDLMLPDGDGIDVLREVHSGQLGTRVAVTTGVLDGDRLEAVRLLRPEAVVRKPVDLELLIRALGPGR